jgi:hypothetical protein
MLRLSLAATLVLGSAALASCSAQSSASKLDYRTFKIHGPGVPGGADAPNRRMADQLCPGGYRVLDSDRYKGNIGEGTYTDWTIRCL